MKEPDAFDRHFWDNENHISQIGRGTIGGKAQGLVNIRDTLVSKFETDWDEKISVNIPKTTIISTEFFDSFLKQNNLSGTALSDLSDERIAAAFQKGSLPPRLVGDLRSIAQQTHSPLAIRSSSLIEDSLNEPLAGVYKTKMTPNNQHSADSRFTKIVEAVKYVWASTFFKEAKQQFHALGRDIQSEKMAVIIQEIIGQRRGNRFYPDISGVARSHNFYPWGNARPEYGIVSLALGLGKTIVDGGHVWSFCPACPKTPPPFCSIKDLLQNTQTKFWAVNMDRLAEYDPIKEIEFMTHPGLEDAEYDNALDLVASTYDGRSDRIISGIGRKGPRIIDFAPILKLGALSLSGAISELLSVCEEHFGVDVEIEFAITIDRDKTSAKLGLVQVRPLSVPIQTIDLNEQHLSDPNAIVASTRAIGNGRRENIRDIVFVDPAHFKPELSARVAKDLEKVNSKLGRDLLPYLLIGFGRFGTSDPWRGIPVTWGQICHTRTIVEVALPSMPFEFSQGSHFFHNVTNLNIGYFYVSENSPYSVDWNWLLQQEIVDHFSLITHVRLENPLTICIDGKQNCGVILKPPGEQ